MLRSLKVPKKSLDFPMDKIIHFLPRIIQPEGDECDHCMEDLVRCNYFVNGGDIQSHLSLVESSLKLWQDYKAAIFHLHA